MTTNIELNSWNGKPYHSLDYHYKEVFGEKVYKLSVFGGMTCPNRDGTISNGGCIFCSDGGSGDFTFNDYTDIYVAGLRKPDITGQLKKAKNLLKNKNTGHKYIAYFQAFTNTYAPVDYLRSIYEEALSDPEVVGLSIGTRPDCLSDEVLSLLKELRKKVPVYVELGLQTVNANTAKLINRGYELHVFDEAVKKLKECDIFVVAHMIVGLPGEEYEDYLRTANHIAALKVDGIKIQLLYLLKGTKLLDYRRQIHEYTLDEYVSILISLIERLPKNMVIQRMTGDGPKNQLIAPLWTTDKKRVLNTITKEFSKRNTWQGKLYDNGHDDII